MPPGAPREGISPVDQMPIYNSPIQSYNRTFTAPPQPHNQTNHMDGYTTTPVNWLSSAYPTNGTTGLEMTGLVPGQIYPGDDTHSSVSSSGDNNSMYSRGNKSSTSSTSSSPHYSYDHPKNYVNQHSLSHSSTPVSPKKDADGKVKRSRMGCLTCRHRKKRCCETKPKCHECARLGLKCSWPAPGSEHRNKPKHVRESDGMHYDPVYGNIKILRGIVEQRVDI